MDTLLGSINLKICPRSVVKTGDLEFGLAHTTEGQKLVVIGTPESASLTAFEGEFSEVNKHTLLIGPLSTYNATMLRSQLEWLQPKLIGLKTSAGMGDRLGIATPGHIRALREFQGKIAPIFAQQSIREMTRTKRSPQQVMDDATWGIFEEGWWDGIGADADHLKTTEEIDACLAAGFTLFTIDPGDYVDNDFQQETLSGLREKGERLPPHLQIRKTDLLKKEFNFDGYRVTLDESTLLKAILKYGNAIAHVSKLYEHLQIMARGRLFEVEVSMDETERPTTPAEHIYIASELRRLGVSWVSFAPRFVGRFEKGVDYIGNAKAFEVDVGIHADIARKLGPYKLSLHSGSDKFTIYSVFMQKTQGLAHLKTAGTSYLEALRTIAELDEDLFREIYIFAREHFETDKQSYLSSAQISRAPLPDQITDWPGLLNQFDGREILHMTYGSVLTEKVGGEKRLFFDRLISCLQTNRELYFRNLENHFRRHLAPFAS
jgi:hypothetical protein